MKKDMALEIRENFKIKYESSNETLDDFIKLYEEQVYTILDNHGISLSKLYLYLELLVAYGDMYKMLAYKNRETMLTEEEYALLDLKKEIEDADDLIATISATPGILNPMFKAMIAFYDLSYLGKYNVINSLSESDNTYLEELILTHAGEKEEYTKEIELLDYVNYFNGETQKAHDTIDVTHFITGIAGFIKNLAKHNYENYVSNIRGLFAFCYEWGKYFIDHDKACLEGFEEVEEFIEVFEKYSLLDLEEEASNNDTLLEMLIDFYINMEPMKEMRDTKGNVITLEVAKQYVLTTSAPETKEKLQF